MEQAISLRLLVMLRLAAASQHIRLLCDVYEAETAALIMKLEEEILYVEKIVAQEIYQAEATSITGRVSVI
ncbi:MAG: hypothetical protein M3014_07385 [Chloroflexota bacterium]|nr:hypothetical protein [Chloroflexota bacterium]